MNQIVGSSKNRDIKDPLLADIDKYMNDLVDKITTAGSTSLKSFNQTYKDNQDKLIQNITPGGGEDSDVEKQLQ